MIKNKDTIDIAYIGGGSMNYCWKFIGELCLEESLAGTVRLFDIDKKLSLANEVIGNKTRELKECKSGMIYIAVDTVEEALRDADFVILSFSVGDTEILASDVAIPQAFGIYQSAGDNTGPGGIMRAIRIIPEYIKYAKKIKELCPEAWVINLSEPMSACLKTLYEVFPAIKAFGCSDDLFSYQDIIADFAQEKLNLPSISRRDIKTNYLGVNKFCFANEILYNGDNLFDIYDEYAKKYAETGYEKKKTDYKANPFANAHKIKFDLFLRYGIIAASNDRYLADNCPPWYLANPKTALSWKIGLMSSNYIKKQKADKIAKCKKLLNDEAVLKLGWSGSDCISQIKAILGHCNIITNVVMPNLGQIPNLPVGAVVETNALFSKNSIKPVYAGTIPENILVLMNRIILNNDLLVKSVFENNLDFAFNVFANDPLVTLDLYKAKSLFEQMLDANKSVIEINSAI